MKETNQQSWRGLLPASASATATAAAAEVVNIVYSESYAYSITQTEQPTELGNFSSIPDEICTKYVIRYDLIDEIVFSSMDKLTIEYTIVSVVPNVVDKHSQMYDVSNPW